MSKVQVDTIDTRSGTSTMQIGSTNTSTINIGVSGDTVNIPSGVTIANAGTATGFGGANTPAFHAYLSGNQTISDNAITVLAANTETFDTASDYDTSNYRFLPAAGKYWIYAAASIYAPGTSDLDSAQMNITKNGSTILRHTAPDYRSNQPYGGGLSIGSIIIANGSDYFTIGVKGNSNSGGNCTISGNAEQPAYFGAFKIIE